MSSLIPGTNIPPISFPGIASGIDYNAIIQKLTSLTLSQNVSLNQQIATLNSANLELIKINSMLASLQNALTALSAPALFSSYDALSSNTAVATAQGIPSVAAAPGTYVIDATQLATATTVTSNPAAGHKETDKLGTSTGDQVPLAQSYAAITPTNGSATSPGQLTIDGVQFSYDVNSQSIDTIFANINNYFNTVAGDASFHIGFVAGTDTVSIADNKPITLGSAGDTGNLLSVLKLAQAQIKNVPAGSTSTVTGTSGVGGINEALTLNSSTNANFVTAVTSGTFTINGVSIAVNASTDNLASVLARINASNAGVIATDNPATNEITLTSKATGAQSIVLGSSSDTSNFLSAAGLTTASGAVVTVGTQASVTLQTAGGATQTVYSNSNQVTDAIQGIQINLTASTNSPFTITVSQDSTQLVSALNTFVSAYNTAINEIDQATAAPAIVSAPSGSTFGIAPSTPVGGGVLYGNADVLSVKDRIEQIASGIVNGNGTSYNSLSQIGLSLDSSFSVLTSSSAQTPSGGSPSGSSSGPVSSTTYAGTSGQFLPLNVAQLQAALSANPSAVQNLLNGVSGVVTQLGTYLTGVTGLPTLLSSGLAGTIPSISVMQGFENANSAEIQSLQQQVQMITNNANQQADALRREFVSTEGQLAQFQALQQQLAGFFKSSGG